MTHGPHIKQRRIFGDDCEECVERANSIPRMVSGLDATNKRRLARLAQEVVADPYGADTPQESFGASRADIKAVDLLRMAARLTFETGISMEIAEGR